MSKVEKETAAHSSIPAWEIPWTEEPGGLQSLGLQRVKTQLSEWTPPPPKDKTYTALIQAFYKFWLSFNKGKPLITY